MPSSYIPSTNIRCCYTLSQRRRGSKATQRPARAKTHTLGESMKNPLAILVLTALLLLLAGCATQGQKMDMQKLGQMRPGVSTIDDAKRLFGEPGQVTRLDDGRTVLAYGYVSQKTDPKELIPFAGYFLSKGTTQELEATRLTFDPSGRYVSYSTYAQKQ